ncbi:hypothetical protein EVAR_20672_1 [Eumeta japonica]|uniref:Uncharacterized protein n=1 Tax=Eumeta variegata TaxID=151549 RepID=A0A4C1V9E2_EUMVA|nr:hypothetical protein EVAR_20672_1 [Eumeta japonica]
MLLISEALTLRCMRRIKVGSLHYRNTKPPSVSTGVLFLWGVSHMGKAWIRLDRSIKVVLHSTLREQTPQEKVLQTLLVEAEHGVNGHPLTHVSVNPADPETLTPNNFLIGLLLGLPVTGLCDEISRASWRRTQFLADQFRS